MRPGKSIRLVEDGVVTTNVEIHALNFQALKGALGERDYVDQLRLEKISAIIKYASVTSSRFMEQKSLAYKHTRSTLLTGIRRLDLRAQDLSRRACLQQLDER